MTFGLACSVRLAAVCGSHDKLGRGSRPAPLCAGGGVAVRALVRARAWEGLARLCVPASHRGCGRAWLRPGADSHGTPQGSQRGSYARTYACGSAPALPPADERQRPLLLRGAATAGLGPVAPGASEAAACAGGGRGDAVTRGGRGTGRGRRGSGRGRGDAGARPAESPEELQTRLDAQARPGARAPAAAAAAGWDPFSSRPCPMSVRDAHERAHVWGSCAGRCRLTSCSRAR